MNDAGSSTPLELSAATAEPSTDGIEERLVDDGLGGNGNVTVHSLLMT